MALYKRGKVYWCSIYRPGGKRVRVSLKTSDIHKARALMAVYGQAMAGKHREYLVSQVDAILDEPAGGLPLTQIKAVYGDFTAGLGKHTAKVRNAHVSQFCAFCAKSRPDVTTADAVTREVALAYIRHLQATALHPKTIANHRGSLSAVWSELLIPYSLPENVWRLVRIPPPESTHGRAFTRDEQARILSACRHTPWAAACLAAKYTGLRRSDIAALSPDNIQGDAIVITPQKTARHGRTILIPIHRKARRYLARPDFGWLNNRGRRWDGQFSQILNRAGVQSGNGHRVSFHCWRHTFKTELIAAGVDENTANKLGAWSEKSKAGRIYDHDTTRLRDAIDRLR